MKKNYRPDKLNNTQWMDLNVWDYILIDVDGIQTLITSHPPYPDDIVKCEVLWRIQVIINKKPYHFCFHANTASRDNPLEHAKVIAEHGVRRKLKEVA